MYLTHNFCIHNKFFDEEISNSTLDIISSKCGYDEIDYAEVACEKYQNYKDFDFCVMTDRTAINSTNFVIADLKDEEVEGISFAGNTKIEYLPYKVYLQLPNLVMYKAERCSIKQITKENFENLVRLKQIDISFNQIQKITANTFRGLHSLEEVDLSEFSMFGSLDFSVKTKTLQTPIRLC